MRSVPLIIMAGALAGARAFVMPARTLTASRVAALGSTRRRVVPRCSAGEVAGDDFVVGTHVDIADLSNEKLVRIVKIETTDEEANELTWQCIGYKQREDGSWDSSDAFRAFREKYDSPPDFIGVTRTYTREVDEPVLRANQMLHRSIPLEHKQGLKTKLKPHGFTGYKLANLTPNMTRRAQVTNWLLYYRDALHGKTLGELKQEKAEARRREAEIEAAQDKPLPPTGTSDQRVV